MRRRTITIAALAAQLAACVNTPALNTPDQDPDLPLLAADRDEPRLALVEHVLANYFASDIVSPPTVCAAIHDGRSEEALPAEQETALIARFPRLAPLSRCTRSGSAWVDSETDTPALVFTVHNFSCPSETSCTGWASYTAGRTSSPATMYTMTYDGNRWTFERDRRLIAE